MSIGVIELALICFTAAITLALIAALVIFFTRSAQRDLQRVPCPNCAELIMPQAKFCRYCGYQLQPAEGQDQQA